MDRYIALLIGCPLSFVILYFRRPIKEFIGDVSFAEKIFGVGGTNTFIVVLGVLLFIGSLMYSMGTLQTLLQGMVGRFF